MTRIILENAFVTGDVHLNKDGEILERQTLIHRLGKLFSAFDYKKTGLEGVEFAVYAAADIEHPDGVTGICFRKGEQVMTGVRSELKEAFGITDRVGELNFQELYLGQYEIRELKTAEGYVRDTEPLIFTLAYQDGYTSPVDPQQGRIAWTNPRQQVNVTITKRDAKTRGTLEGAEIGLYTAKDVRNAQGQLLIPADTLLELGRTDAEGKLFFASDVPFGSYYVKEVTAPEGYQLTEELQEFEFAYAGENTGIVEKNLTILNEKKPAKSGRTPQQTPPAATGDQAAPGLYLALLCAALFVMAYIRTELQRKKQKK